jgi:D-xylose transport system ATP-binding protein
MEHDIHNVMKLCNRTVTMKNSQRVGRVSANDLTNDGILGMIIMGQMPVEVR